VILSPQSPLYKRHASEWMFFKTIRKTTFHGDGSCLSQVILIVVASRIVVRVCNEGRA
jgi:hypothetical protein